MYNIKKKIYSIHVACINLSNRSFISPNTWREVEGSILIILRSALVRIRFIYKTLNFRK